MHKWNPEEYAKHSSAQLAWARELIARLKLGGDETVLDIGSGDGKVTAEIAASVPHGRVVGIDGSPEMVKFAHAHFDDQRVPNLEFACIEARMFALTGCLDYVFSTRTLTS